MTTWSNSQNIQSSWGNQSTDIIVSGYSNYDDSGLTYDLSGQSYEYKIPRNNRNKLYIWGETTSNNTIWQ